MVVFRNRNFFQNLVLILRFILRWSDLNSRNNSLISELSERNSLVSHFHLESLILGFIVIVCRFVYQPHSRFIDHIRQSEVATETGHQPGGGAPVSSDVTLLQQDTDNGPPPAGGAEDVYFIFSRTPV